MIVLHRIQCKKSENNRFRKITIYSILITKPKLNFHIIPHTGEFAGNIGSSLLMAGKAGLLAMKMHSMNKKGTPISSDFGKKNPPSKLFGGMFGKK